MVNTERVKRGLELHTLVKQQSDGWHVPSASRDREYVISNFSCTCEDFEKGQAICKHIWASTGYVAAVIVNDLQTKVIDSFEAFNRLQAIKDNMSLGIIRTVEQAIREN